MVVKRGGFRKRSVFFSCLSPNLRPTGECCRWFGAPHFHHATCTMPGDHRDKERGDEGDRHRSLGKWLGSLKEDPILLLSSWMRWIRIFIRWVLVNMRSSFHSMNAKIHLTLLRFYFPLLSLDRGLSHSIIK